MSMAEASTSSLTLSITLLPTNTSISLDLNATIFDLQSLIASSLSIPVPSQKLILKGKRLDGQNQSQTRLNSIGIKSGSRILVIGSSQAVLDSTKAAGILREKKKLALQFHLSHPVRPVTNTSRGGIKEEDSYRFGTLTPFTRDFAPHFEKREAMLKRLSEDPGVRNIMIQNKLVVGNLTELHPTLQPTLLGLNKNAGEQISLRLLTDELDGLRSEAEIMKVLLHELVHNLQGPHDEKFNRLNSQFNKDLIKFRQENGISTRFDSSVWSPSSNPITEAERKSRFDRRLDEVEVGVSNLEFDEFDELEARREKMRLAAESRMKGGG